MSKERIEELELRVRELESLLKMAEYVITDLSGKLAESRRKAEKLANRGVDTDA